MKPVAPREVTVPPPSDILACFTTPKDPRTKAGIPWDDTALHGVETVAPGTPYAIQRRLLS